MDPMIKILMEVEKERERTTKKYSHSEDDQKTASDWCNNITGFTSWAEQLYGMKKPEEYRKKMVQIAALAVACLESFDRHIEISDTPAAGLFTGLSFDLNDMEIE